MNTVRNNAGNLTRRTFIAAAAGSVAAAGIAGASSALAEVPSAEEDKTPVETYDYDIVICGTGAAGMTAACRAGQLGANAIVLEALDESGIGGATNNAEGMGVYFNDDEEGTIGKSLVDIETNYKMGLKNLTETFERCLDYHKNQCNSILLKLFLERSLPMYRWMTEEVGVEFQTPETAAQMYKGNDEMSGGHLMTKVMYGYAKDHGVEFMFNTAGKELIMEDGRVVGILARRFDGSWIQINCRAVVMAGGGYLANRELFEKYTKQNYDGFMMYGSCGKEMGEAYTMGEAVGAAFHHPECIQYCGPILPGYFNKAKITVCCANDATNLWVNERGQRFINEANANDWAQSGAAGGQWKKTVSIIDSEILKFYEEVGPKTGRGGYVRKNTPCEGVTEQVEAAVLKDRPIAFKADTLEELAELVGVDPAGLVATVARYNEICEAGVDDDFFKAEDCLLKIATPPFYAFSMRIGTYTCNGGLKVNENFEVLDVANFDPIPGFYAAGGDAGGLQGSQYDRKVAAGSTQQWSHQGGYYAVDHIVNVYLPSLA